MTGDNSIVETSEEDSNLLSSIAITRNHSFSWLVEAHEQIINLAPILYCMQKSITNNIFKTMFPSLWNEAIILNDADSVSLAVSRH